MQQRIKASQSLQCSQSKSKVTQQTASEDTNTPVDCTPSNNPMNTTQTKSNRRKVNPTETKPDTYDLAKISTLAHTVMQQETKKSQDTSNQTDYFINQTDCFLPSPTQVASMMKRVYETEFPHMDVNKVFVAA